MYLQLKLKKKKVYRLPRKYIKHNKQKYNIIRFALEDLCIPLNISKQVINQESSVHKMNK